MKLLLDLIELNLLATEAFPANAVQRLRVDQCGQTFEEERVQEQRQRVGSVVARAQQARV